MLQTQARGGAGPYQGLAAGGQEDNIQRGMPLSDLVNSARDLHEKPQLMMDAADDQSKNFGRMHSNLNS